MAATKSTTKPKKTIKTETEVKKPKQVVINRDTLVRVYNNTTGSVSFKDVQGQWVRIRNKGFAEVRFADLENLYNISPQMLDSGTLYIAWQPVREKLGLTYENIFALKDVQDILDKPVDELAEILGSATRTLQVEVAQYVVEHIEELNVRTVNTVEKVTNIPVMDISRS